MSGGTPQAERDSTEFDVDQFVQHYYPIYGIDTTGSEPLISVWIETKGIFDQLDSLGISTVVRHGNAISTRIPVRLIPVIGKLGSVNHLIFGSRVFVDGNGDSASSFLLRGRGGLSAVLGRTACDLPAVILLIIQKYHKNRNTVGPDAFDTSLSLTARFDTAGTISLTDLAPGLYKISFGLGRDSKVGRDAVNAIINSECPEVIVDSVVIYDDLISIIDLGKPLADYFIKIENGINRSGILQLKWVEKYRDIR
jgi:hypothetical protein